MKKIRFLCTNCGTKLRVPTHLVGVSAPCPKCGFLVTAPDDIDGAAEMEPAVEAFSAAGGAERQASATEHDFISHAEPVRQGPAAPETAPVNVRVTARAEAPTGNVARERSAAPPRREYSSLAAGSGSPSPVARGQQAPRPVRAAEPTTVSHPAPPSEGEARGPAYRPEPQQRVQAAAPIAPPQVEENRNFDFLDESLPTERTDAVHPTEWREDSIHLRDTEDLGSIELPLDLGLSAEDMAMLDDVYSYEGSELSDIVPPNDGESAVPPGPPALPETPLSHETQPIHIKHHPELSDNRGPGSGEIDLPRLDVSMAEAQRLGGNSGSPWDADLPPVRTRLVLPQPGQAGGQTSPDDFLAPPKATEPPVVAGETARVATTGESEKSEKQESVSPPAMPPAFPEWSTAPTDAALPPELDVAVTDKGPELEWPEDPPHEPYELPTESASHLTDAQDPDLPPVRSSYIPQDQIAATTPPTWVPEEVGSEEPEQPVQRHLVDSDPNVTGGALGHGTMQNLLNQQSGPDVSSTPPLPEAQHRVPAELVEQPPYQPASFPGADYGQQSQQPPIQQPPIQQPPIQQPPAQGSHSHTDAPLERAGNPVSSDVSALDEMFGSSGMETPKGGISKWVIAMLVVIPLVAIALAALLYFVGKQLEGYTTGSLEHGQSETQVENRNLESGTPAVETPAPPVEDQPVEEHNAQEDLPAQPRETAPAAPGGTVEDVPAVKRPEAPQASTMTLPGDMAQPVRIMDQGQGTVPPPVESNEALSVGERVERIMGAANEGGSGVATGVVQDQLGTVSEDVNKAIGDFLGNNAPVSGLNVAEDPQAAADALGSAVADMAKAAGVDSGTVGTVTEQVSTVAESLVSGQGLGSEAESLATSLVTGAAATLPATSALAAGSDNAPVLKNYNPPATFPAPGPGDTSLSKLYDVIDAFLRAPDTDARLRYTYHGDSLRPAVEEYLKKWQPRVYERYSLQLFEAVTDISIGGPYWVFMVSTSDQDSGFPLIVRVENGTLKVDWEIFTEFSDQHFVAFKKGSLSSPQTLRALIVRKSDYFGSDKEQFSTLNQYLVYEVSTPYGSSPDHSMFAFVQKNSALATKLDDSIKLGEDALAVILTLDLHEFPHGTKHWVITDYVTEGWFR